MHEWYKITTERAITGCGRKSDYISAEEGERVVHEQEVVDQLLEQKVIKAMNEVTEEMGK